MTREKRIEQAKCLLRDAGVDMTALDSFLKEQGKCPPPIGERGNPVQGFRHYEFKEVDTVCPHCKRLQIIDPRSLRREQIWYEEVFEHECEDCGKSFYVEVNDED